MDYEKEYKELHTFISDLYPFMSEYCKEKVEGFLPELKESEDERIRKEIINYFTKGKEYLSLCSIGKDDILAWLEKQKPAQNINKEDEEVRQYIIRTMEQKDINVPMVQKALDWLEKQGSQILANSAKTCKDEQNPADKVKPKFKVKYDGSEYNVFDTKDIAGVTFYGIEDEPNHIDYVKAENCDIISVYGIKESGLSIPTKPVMFSGEKPKRMISAEAKEAMYDKPACAWSEEDENVLEDIKEAIINYWHGDTQDILLDWLKSLKERIGGKL